MLLFSSTNFLNFVIRSSASPGFMSLVRSPANQSATVSVPKIREMFARFWLTYAPRMYARASAYPVHPSVFTSRMRSTSSLVSIAAIIISVWSRLSRSSSSAVTWQSSVKSPTHR